MEKKEVNKIGIIIERIFYFLSSIFLLHIIFKYNLDMYQTKKWIALTILMIVIAFDIWQAPICNLIIPDFKKNFNFKKIKEVKNEKREI